MPLLVAALVACAGAPSGLSPDAQSRIAGRVVITAESEASDPRRAPAKLANPTPLTAPLAGTLASALGNFNEANRTRVGAVPRPSRDPSQLARSILVAHLVTSQQALRGLRPLDATGIVATTPAARGAEIFARARLQGFPGVIVDLHPTGLEVRSRGVGLGLRAERFYLRFTAVYAIVDAADGRLIAQGGCEGTSRALSYTLTEIEAGGSAVFDESADLAAQQCAAEIIARDLLPRG